MADETRRARARLDQPVSPRRLSRPSYDPEAFGRLSERIARLLGTGRFLVFQTAVIGIWVLLNVALPSSGKFDGYPFLFLTLVLSLQAAYAAPLILLAQNRQDDRDRVNLEQDRQQFGQQVADTEFVARELAAVRLALGDVVTRDFLRSELRLLLEETDSDRESARKDRKVKKKKADQNSESGGEALSSEPEAPMPFG
jgi:uncharacterized membrane protein